MSAAVDSAPRPRVGEYLRRLRGEKNMSLEEAAARLFLQSRVLKAIERDDYETLPEVYLRGHLRNYAKLLGAPPEEILAMYREDIAEPEEAPPATAATAATAQPAAKPPVRNAAADSHLAALALVVFAWWLGAFILERAAPPAVEVAAPPPAPPPPPQLDYAVTTVEHPAAPMYRAAAEEDAAAGDLVAVGRGPDTIKITLTEDSWIEVLDAANEKVYYDLGRAGQTLVLNGAAPFSVLLGAARGVTLEFNGTPFDVVPYSSRNNLARFVLGE